MKKNIYRKKIEAVIACILIVSMGTAGFMLTQERQLPDIVELEPDTKMNLFLQSLKKTPKVLLSGFFLSSVLLGHFCKRWGSPKKNIYNGKAIQERYRRTNLDCLVGLLA
jgi:hypothetical protein